MRGAIRSAAAALVLIAAVGVSAFAVSRSPLAAFRPSSFAAFGWRLTLSSAYADPSSTVLVFSGVPSRTIFGGVLYDELGVAHQSYLARNDDGGNLAIDFDRLGWLAATFAARYRLLLDGRPVATFTVPPGGGSSLPAPAGGSFSTGSVDFSALRYGGRALFVDVEFHGVDVAGGFECGEACPRDPKPGLEMWLVPTQGGSPVGFGYPTPGRDGDVVVHAVAMLVDPGVYPLVLSLGEVTLERPVVIG